MMADSLNHAHLSVTELGALYRSATLSPTEVLEAALRRQSQMEPALNAFAHVMADKARAEARQATVDLAMGRDLGPLHGIPVAIKDLIEVKGVPTGWGTKVEPPRIATEDAALVARLRAAGAVPLQGNLDDPASLRRLAGLATRVLHLAPPPGTGLADPRSLALVLFIARYLRGCGRVARLLCR